MHYTKAKSLLSRWNSMNIYRGCLHGCIYCDSRSHCYQFTHPFEDVEIKDNAPELLENILRTKKNKIMISTGAMSDPYQPYEKQLQLTRKCLELIDHYGFGATIITKSDLVLRDIDLFESINNKSKAVLQMTLTIADEELSKVLEPNVCTSKHRFEVLKEFQKRGIPTIVWITPLLPYLTDTKENMETLLNYCIDAGVKGIICPSVGLTLRDGNREYYYKALDHYYPGLSDIYKKKYGNSYQVISDNNNELMKFFHETCEKHGIMHNVKECFYYTSEFPEKYKQLSLFD